MKYVFEQSEMWDVLKKASPRNSKIIYENRNLSLKDFLLHQVFSDKEYCEFTMGNRRTVAKKLGEIAEQLYPKEGEIAYLQFMEFPLLQVGSHSGLLYDKQIFLNNYLFDFVLREYNLNFAFSKQCSRIKGQLNSKNLSGPGYLELDKSVYNIFDLPKSTLLRAHIAAMGEVAIKFYPVANCDFNTASVLPQVLENLKGRVFPRAVDAFRQSNIEIWRQMPVFEGRKYVPFDEDLVSDVIFEFIQSKNQVVYGLLFDRNIRSDFLDAKKKILTDGNNCLLKNTSDFFYYKRDGELKPLRINSLDNTFFERESHKLVPIELTPENVSSALKERTLYADLIFSYICLHLLPNTEAFGGTSQQEYYPLIQKLLSLVNEKNEIFPQKYFETNSSKFLGTELIQASLIENIISDLNNDQQYGCALLNTKIGQLVGELDNYSYMKKYI